MSGSAGSGYPMKEGGSELRSEWWRPPESASEAGLPGQPDPAVMPASRFDLASWAVAAFTVILLLAPQERFPALAPLRIALLCAAVAAIACTVKRVKARMPILEMSPDVVLILLLVFWAVMTLPLSVWPGGSAGFLTGIYIKSVLCFLLLSHALTGFRQLWGICWCLVLCTVPLTLTTLANYAAGISLAEGSDRVLGYTSGLTQNPNDMALMLNLILPLCLALMLGTRNALGKLALAATTVLIVVAVILTFSRAGFLTLAFIGASYAWLLRKRPQRMWIPVIMILGVFALPLVPGDFFGRIETIVQIENDQTQSAQNRLADMKVATSAAFSKPITGSGIGMSILAMNEARGERWIDIHNVYLQLALDLGFIGLMLFVLLLLQCLRVTGALLSGREDRGAPDRMVLIAEALRVSLLAFALSAMFYPVAYNFYFYYFAGLAMAAWRIARSAEAPA
ncbi:MAG: O-antigen ligase family protein [Xanthomonadales bacterium]|jgi:O-antigen ligase|nr:O-antigen ligase family protein [Xanthomonadales bacterium]